jgi:hypothetical protein
MPGAVVQTVIPAFRRQEDFEFKASLSYVRRPCINPSLLKERTGVAHMRERGGEAEGGTSRDQNTHSLVYPHIG